MMPGTGPPITEMDSKNPIPNTGFSDIIQDGTDITETLTIEDSINKTTQEIPRKPKIPKKPTWLKTWVPVQKKTVATQSDPSALSVSDKLKP